MARGNLSEAFVTRKRLGASGRLPSQNFVIAP